MELSVGWAARLPRARYSASSHATTTPHRTSQARQGWVASAGRPAGRAGRGRAGRAGQGHHTKTRTARATIGTAVTTSADTVKAVVVAATTA